MKTDKFWGLIAMIPLILALSGCGMFFAQSHDPASSRSTLSMRLGTLQADSSGNVSRAIVQGDGYLYIRTIGGPTGSTGPFYGPYSVSSGSTFTTNEIPAGTYSKLFVIYSGKLLNDPTKFAVLGGSYSFTEFMSAPDDLLSAFLDQVNTDTKTTDPGQEALGNSFEGMASYGLRQNLTLPGGGTTNLTMILSPISGSNTEIQLWQSSSYTFSSTSSVRRFYRLSGVNVLLPVTAGNLSCTLSADSATSGSISNVAFFDSNGNQVTTTKTGSSLTGGYTWTMDPATINASVTSSSGGYGYVELMMYIEFSGTVNARFSNTVPPNVFVSVTGNSTAAWQGHRMLFAVYDQTAYTNINAGQSWSTQAPIGFGIVDLDTTTGSGSMTTQCGTLAAGSTYYISAQIDTGNYYSSLTNTSGVDVSTIVPYQGDLLTTSGSNGLIPFVAGSAISLSAANFMTYTDYVYFVSSAGGGTGATPSSPMTLANAISAVNALPTNSQAQVYVMDNISGLPGGYAMTKSVDITSYGYTTYTLASGSLSGNNFFSNVASVGLTFERINLDASSSTASSVPILSTAGSLTLGYGTTLVGTTNSTSMSGAGVYSTGTFTMNGSTITNCRQSTTSSGGGLYLAGGTATLKNGATIKNCGYSMTTGGAIYTDTGSTLNLVSANITSNLSTGGAIYYVGTVNATIVNFSGNTNGDKMAGGGTWNQL